MVWRPAAIRHVVSIRSPHRSKGRPLSLATYFNTGGFQSAPLTEARGDLVAAFLVFLAYVVSIRSPHRSKGRSSVRSPCASVVPFQSAPLTEARGV